MLQRWQGSLEVGSAHWQPSRSQGSDTLPLFWVESAWSGSQVDLLPLFLKHFPSLGLSLLPCSSFPGGEDWASGGAICHVFAQPFAGDEHPPGMPAPSLSFCCANGAPPNPNKAISIRIWIQLQYITYKLRFRLQKLSGVHVYAGSAPGPWLTLTRSKPMSHWSFVLARLIIPSGSKVYILAICLCYDDLISLLSDAVGFSPFFWCTDWIACYAL